MRIINGIQQVGIGVTDAEQAFAWYRAAFGTDLVIFRDHARASLMKRYTGHTEHERYAILSMNICGGGGLEIWQYKSRTPSPRQQSFSLADLGILAVKIKSFNIDVVFREFRTKQFNLLSEVLLSPDGKRHFFLRDPFGNLFDVEEAGSWFRKPKKGTGAVSGIMIGVSDMERAREFYKISAGYEQVLYDQTGCFEDLADLREGDAVYRRLVLRKADRASGGFSRLLGDTSIELIQRVSGSGQHVYQNRFWGDPGFIHVCFDISDFDDHAEICSQSGYPLTIDSRSAFEMGEASGHFGYNEDPDGTLIEYVETHRVPILKKLGWYLNLKKRDPRKPLPDWMVSCLAFNREKASK